MTFLNITDLDRTVFYAINSQVIHAGYFVDPTLYTDPAVFNTALQTLKQSLPLKELIYVYGVNDSKNRNENTPAQIIINRTQKTSGTVGGGVSFYEKNLDNTFSKYKLPENTTTVSYEIRIATNIIDYERIMFALISKALGTRKVLNCLSDRAGTADKNIQFDKISDYDSGSNYNFIQRVLIYELRDIFLEEFTDAPTIIQPINAITVTIKPK